MTEIGLHLLGRTVEHDPHNWAYRSAVRRVQARRNIIHDCRAPILDQGELGSCGGNTAVEWLNCGVALGNRMQTKLNGIVRRHPKYYLTEPDAVEMYSAATQLDDDGIPGKYPPSDTGTSAVGLGKAMVLFDSITVYNWTFTFESFLANLQQQPIMVGTNWYESMFDPNASGYVVPLGTDPAGGHEYLARGVSFTQQYILCRNHWTKDWGVKGEFKISFGNMNRLLNEQGDSLVPGLIAKGQL